MQSPFQQLYSEAEFSEDSYSEEDYRIYELNCPCCKCLGKEQFNNLHTKSVEKQMDRRYCMYLETNREKPKVKGKFGLAYVVQTSKENSLKPSGWQVEFQDTPSQIDRNCEKMVKWVTCPPLGKCNANMEALWCPSDCKELLKTAELRKHNSDREHCCLIEIPKVKSLSIAVNETCQANAKKEKMNKPRNLECVCTSKNKTKVETRACPCLQKQFEKFTLCRKCCKPLTKCTCNLSSDNTCDCGKNQLKYKRQPSPKNLNGESDQDTSTLCKHCKKSKSYNPTVKERICRGCGKVMEKNCYVKENCMCESYDDSLDYIPKREICIKKKCKQMKDGSSQIKTKDIPKPENETKRESLPKTADKMSHTDRKPSQVENKVPETTVPKEEAPTQENKIEIKEEPKPVESENEILVQDLDAVVGETPPNRKTFSTRAHGDEPSLLERIKQARHKQIHEIHPEIPL